MNAVDATDRESRTEAGVPPSLLTIILDTNPHAWALLADALPLSKIIANLLVFINAHLAINHANRVAVVASHAERAQWLYPTPELSKSTVNGREDGGPDIDMQDAGGPVQPAEDANKYRPFAHIEHALTSNLRSLMTTTSESDLTANPSTMIAGALTMALTYISKSTLNAPSTATSSSAEPSNAAGAFNFSTTDGTQQTSTSGLTSRILVVSVSGDLANQYIPIMNSIFACQRLHIPIDILKLAGDTVFLQQAADATGGIYMAPGREQTKGVLQYLMMAYLPDQSAREWFILPGEGEGVDFRAACFCHRRVVDIGFVCSICLSIFCEPLMDSTCLTCGTHLSLSNYGTKPVVVPKRKKKKKRVGGLEGDGRAETPVSGADTPGP